MLKRPLLPDAPTAVFTISHTISVPLDSPEKSPLIPQKMQEQFPDFMRIHTTFTKTNEEMTDYFFPGFESLFMYLLDQNWNICFFSNGHPARNWSLIPKYFKKALLPYGDKDRIDDQVNLLFQQNRLAVFSRDSCEREDGQDKKDLTVIKRPLNQTIYIDKTTWFIKKDQWPFISLRERPSLKAEYGLSHGFNFKPSLFENLDRNYKPDGLNKGEDEDDDSLYSPKAVPFYEGMRHVSQNAPYVLGILREAMDVMELKNVPLRMAVTEVLADGANGEPYGLKWYLETDHKQPNPDHRRQSIWIEKGQTLISQMRTRSNGIAFDRPLKDFGDRFEIKKMIRAFKKYNSISLEEEELRQPGSLANVIRALEQSKDTPYESFKLSEKDLNNQEFIDLLEALKKFPSLNKFSLVDQTLTPETSAALQNFIHTMPNLQSLYFFRVAFPVAFLKDLPPLKLELSMLEDTLLVDALLCGSLKHHKSLRIYTDLPLLVERLENQTGQGFFPQEFKLEVSGPDKKRSKDYLTFVKFCAPPQLVTTFAREDTFRSALDYAAHAQNLKSLALGFSSAKDHAPKALHRSLLTALAVNMSIENIDHFKDFHGTEDQAKNLVAFNRYYQELRKAVLEVGVQSIQDLVTEHRGLSIEQWKSKSKQGAQNQNLTRKLKKLYRISGQLPFWSAKFQQTEIGVMDVFNALQVLRKPAPWVSGWTSHWRFPFYQGYEVGLRWNHQEGNPVELAVNGFLNNPVLIKDGPMKELCVYPLSKVSKSEEEHLNRFKAGFPEIPVYLLDRPSRTQIKTPF